MIAFFASRQCPGNAIRACTAWALAQARERYTVVGGFHSPLEQSVLRLLLEAGGSAAVVLARPVAIASLNSPLWGKALAAGRVALVSQVQQPTRLDAEAALARNELAARLADWITIGHASPGGALQRQCAAWLIEGLKVRPLYDSDPAP